ncbi:MAG: glycosyltransferase family 2 protein [Candidatus Sungbacteria bacterium]|uniref:dolichyl-phosphate beta-glucosyltransferase n=1 Tax=Candidatus Sungiibacteriota bacterium TaxID=2750080 RepID=A0A932YXH5_9BACT|nr:glycosyltransferase family 2 protein [Candidatus Sungbacteria bacterium]
MYLSWIIPAYNEEERIASTVRAVDRYLMQKSFDYEIIVVDNASSDRTADIVEHMRQEFPRLRILQTKGPGKGWAVRHGMLEASGEIRCFADADNSVSPEQADAFLPLVCSTAATGACFDVVIGSIGVPGAIVMERAQWYRRTLGKLAKLVIRIVSGLWEIRDSQRGFKFFSRRAAETIFPKQRLTGWGFDFELLLIARRNGLATKELPVKWVNPPGSKVSLKAYATTLMELFRMKWNDLRGRYGSRI